MRYVYLAMLPLAMLSCPSRTSQPDEGPSSSGRDKTSSTMREGWLRAVAEKPGAAKPVLQSACWQAFFGADFFAALRTARADSVPDQLCRGRISLELAEIYSAHARLLATTQKRAFQSRRRGTGLPPLESEPYHIALGALWSSGDGEAEEVFRVLKAEAPANSDYGALAAAWAQRCGQGNTVLNGIRCRSENRPWPECGKMAGEIVGLSGRWKERVRGYREAWCAEDSGTLERLRDLASRPSARQRVTDGATNLEGEAEFFDPVALVVLSDVYLRAARALFEAAGEAALADLAGRRLGYATECRGRGAIR